MAGMTIRAVKAKHGDALLLFAGGATVLIDGGPSGVYRRYLRDQLLALDGNGEEPAQIDLMMVSHIDADHIDGILDLTAELLEAREEDRDPIVEVKRAWHNSFADTIARASAVGNSSQVRSEAASVASCFDEFDLPGLDPQLSKLVLSSVGQGRQLRLDLKALNISINQRFSDRMALQQAASGPWKCGDLSIDVIGPTEKEISDLQAKWAKELERILNKEADMSLAAKSMDASVSNLASIVVVAEAGGKRALLTGDARGKMIVKWLEQTGRLQVGGNVHFDLLKLPHHGSDRNVTPDFFRRVTADHYLICGDGGHGNPEPAALEMLFEARPDLNYTVHMTYGPEDLKQHKKFKKVGNVAQLKKVLNADRSKVLNYPSENATFIDIAL